MAGRPPKKDKKIREAIYFEPELLEWLQEKAEQEKCTVSVLVNRMTAQAKEQEG
ncbi:MULTISPECIES: hypothetical protein [Paenibacillus]|uniref:hypothetical protein n=1 Tax=Paenibacillus TaxID=44249 RepID=UPI0004B2BDB9|nr:MULTISPECIES: hypothetical protein [Paenibacillus]MCV9947775.1 hypothetical protein [Paenibacillus sp. BT-177]KAF6614365.1 hypothetical protein HFE00_25330 [Paenibacillus sp. EKM101P]KAF6624580.1 hypothetical protein HFE03_03290 [Paenibacillus sp. EKM102P]KAF6635641.1 hypothetical protein HFE01_01740 [Paenibacillus sp. EKM10P]KAF6648649.1 hypothetical protein HFE02_09810 [Paenibacillus sp. EKM11P]